jgi:hypothetical protein
MSPDFVPAVLIYSLGTYAFGAILFYGFVRPKVQMDCLGRGEDQSTRLADWAGTAISVASFLWFIALLSLTLLRVVPDAPRWQLRVVVLFLQFAYPALIMTAVFADIQSPTPRLRSVAWRVPPIIAAVAGMAAFVWSILGFRGLIDVAGRTVGIVAGAITALLFAGCAVYSVIALKVANASIQRSNERGAKRQSMIGLYYYLLVMTFVMVLLAVSDVGWERLGFLVGTSMPLLFVSVAIYHEHRFAFFDLILKRGLALMLTIGATTGYLALMLPLLGRLSLEGRRAFVYAVALLPVTVVLPWLYRKLGSLLDRLWLGRRFTTVEAVKEFLSGLQRATDERELVRHAESGLSTIFGAPTRIDLKLQEAPGLDFECVLDLPVSLGEGRAGVIRMGKRRNQIPYFSEEIALLGSLAEVFAYMLENVRLQQRKQEQEQSARELSLQASRSELKALRAQINPHFLFNALNAIAGLIHKDPFRADATVERLAEVFRYTLRRSEAEWALLEDELEFCQSYLEVEQARFGDRLRVEIAADPDTLQVSIPTMIVQTLVENAVKHGVAQVRGTARLTVNARLHGERLRVEVADNGPGFAIPSPGRATEGEGFGLKSVRQRLEGHFGDRAAMEVERDDRSGTTVVAISLPPQPPTDQSVIPARTGPGAA